VGSHVGNPRVRYEGSPCAHATCYDGWSPNGLGALCARRGLEVWYKTDMTHSPCSGSLIRWQQGVVSAMHRSLCVMEVLAVART